MLLFGAKIRKDFEKTFPKTFNVCMKILKEYLFLGE